MLKCHFISIFYLLSKSRDHLIVIQLDIVHTVKRYCSLSAVDAVFSEEEINSPYLWYSATS